MHSRQLECIPRNDENGKKICPFDIFYRETTLLRYIRPPANIPRDNNSKK